MRCPRCSSQNLERYKGPVARGGDIYRQKKCKDCGRRFMTVETAVGSDVALMLGIREDLV